MNFWPTIEQANQHSAEQRRRGTGRRSNQVEHHQPARQQEQQMRNPSTPHGDPAGQRTDCRRDPRQQHWPLDKTVAIEIRRQPVAILDRAAREADHRAFLEMRAAQRHRRERKDRPQQDHPGPARHLDRPQPCHLRHEPVVGTIGDWQRSVCGLAHQLLSMS
jgi:hypothetical protein